MTRSWIRGIFGPKSRTIRHRRFELTQLEARDVPATFYVSPSFTAGATDIDLGTAGIQVDGDLVTAGDQVATVGTDAFDTINAAIAKVTAGTDLVIVNAGDYSGEGVVSVTSGYTLTLQDTAIKLASLESTVNTATINLNTALTVGDATDRSITSVIGGTGGSLVKIGTGKLTLTNTNTFSGVTNVNEGIVAISAAAALGATGATNNTIVANGATLEVSGAVTIAEPITINGDGTTTGFGALRHTGTSNTIYSGVVTLGSSSRINNTSATAVFTVGTSAVVGGGFDLTVGGGGNTTISGSISSLGNGALSIDGGKLTLTATSTWAGAINVTGGATLQFSAITQVGGTGLITLDNGTLLNTQVIATGGNGSFLPSATAGSNRNVFLGNGGGTWLWNGGSGTALIIFGAVSTITGPGGLTTNSVNSDGVTKTAAISVSGAGTYSGPTHVTGGVLRVRSTANRFPVDTDLTVDTGAEFNPNGVSQRVGSLSGGGNITLGSASFTVGNAVGKNTTFTGVISGTGRFTTTPPTGVSWTNTQTLTGNSTYTNGSNFVTLVGTNGGTLVLGNTTGSALGTNTNTAATQNVNDGGILASVSTSNDGITVTPLNILGTIAPGNIGATGRLTTGVLTVGATGIFDADIKGTTAGFGPTGYDQLVVNGTVTIASGAKLNFNNTGLTSALGDSFTLIDNDGTDVITGTFKDAANNDLLQNALFTADGQLFRISYTGGTGNDVVVTRANAFDKYYVSPTFTATGTTVDGDNVIAGSQDAVVGTKAFSTIAAALAASQAGDQIVINAGTYPEAIDLGASDRQLVFQDDAITINSLNGTSAATIMSLGTQPDGITGIILTMGGDNASTTFAGSISGPGGIIYSGDGTFTLSGVNSYSGLTSIVTGPGGNGRWIAGSTAALSVVSPVDLTNSRLSLNGFSNQIGNLSGNAASIVENGSAANNAVLSAGASKTAGGVFDLTFDGTMRDGAGGKSYGFVKLGSGTLTIPNNYAYTGPFTLGGGIYTVATLPDGTATAGTNPGPFGASSNAVGNFTISGGARLNYTGPTTTMDRNINWGTGGGTLDIGTNDVALSGVLTSAGGLLGSFVKEGTGKLTFTNANAFQGGAVNSQTAYASLATGNVTVNAGDLSIGNLRLKGQYRGTASDQRTLTIATGATVTATGTIAIDPSSTYVTVIGGSGTLLLRNATADKVNNPTIAFDYGPSGGDSVPFGSRINAALDFGSVPAFIIGKADHNDVARLGGDLIFNSSITGTAAINFVGLTSTTQTKSSNIHFVLNQQNPSFTGSVFIANCDLALTNNNALSSVNNVTFNSAPNAATTNRGALFLFGHTVTIGSLDDQSTGGTTSQIRNGSQATATGGTGTSSGAAGAFGVDSDANLTITQSVDGKFTGAILDGPYDFEDGTAPTAYRKTNIVKEGAAIMTLSGASSLTGTVSVNNGTLLQNGSFTAAASVVGVTSTATFGGTGTTKAVNVSGTITGGTVGSAGKLTTGNLAATVSTVVADVTGSGSVAGTDFDQINVVGTVDISGATLTINSTASPAIGTPLVIVNNDLTDAITGTFNGINEGDTVVSSGNGNKYTVSYVGGDGNDVTLTRVQSNPSVVSFVVNGGDRQRSRILSVEVTFDANVDTMLAQYQALGAVTFTRTALPTRVTTAQVGDIIRSGETDPGVGIVNVALGSANNKLLFTFDNTIAGGPGTTETKFVEYTSLTDGYWKFTVLGGTGSVTGDVELRRLFGDKPADLPAPAYDPVIPGTINGADLDAFGQVFSSNSVAFDYDNNGTINGADLDAFGNRFSNSL
ncbi:hypothetical protein BH11PLA2_BH11PLA2_45450 [soil metagenome]